MSKQGHKGGMEEKGKSEEGVEERVREGKGRNS